MGFFDKNVSLSKLKGALAEATAVAQEAATAAKEKATELGGQLADASRELSDKASAAAQEAWANREELQEKALETSKAAGTKALAFSKSAAETASELGHKAYVLSTESASQAAEAIRAVDTEKLKDPAYLRERVEHYANLGKEKTVHYFKSTFEVDKSTLDIVEGVRGRLPVPAATVDDIFVQCRNEAFRRAVAVFMLGDSLRELDEHSAAKYDNLSTSYKDFASSTPSAGRGHENYSAMSNTRADADILGTLDNGYNRDAPQFKSDVDVEHVVSRKEIYADPLIRVATTNDEVGDVMNDKSNLIFANSSLNRSKGDSDLFEYIQRNGQDDPTDPNKVIVTIPSTGETHELDKRDVEAAYQQAQDSLHAARVAAAVEVGTTIAQTGAYMAAQQVVGLIVVETIDIFTDEIKRFTKDGHIINEDGWIQNAKDSTERMRLRLSERFEERKLWERARTVGAEAGVAGALSVIPQILISLFLKMPSLVLAIIRESTLSTVRCVRVLCSDDKDKLSSLKVIMLGAASAIAGVYVQRVVSNGIAAVPMLNHFNSHISSVLTGLIVTAVPLVAIYTFDQNKQKLIFVVKQLPFSSPK